MDHDGRVIGERAAIQLIVKPAVDWNHGRRDTTVAAGRHRGAATQAGRDIFGARLFTARRPRRIILCGRRCRDLTERER